MLPEAAAEQFGMLIAELPMLIAAVPLTGASAIRQCGLVDEPATARTRGVSVPGMRLPKNVLVVSDRMASTKDAVL